MAIKPNKKALNLFKSFMIWSNVEPWRAVASVVDCIRTTQGARIPHHRPTESESLGRSGRFQQGIGVVEWEPHVLSQQLGSRHADQDQLLSSAFVVELLEMASY